MRLKFNKENKKAAKRYLLGVFLLVAFFVAAPPVFADVTYPETPTAFDNTAGLEDVKEDVYLETDTDIRLIVIRIINVFLGLLGLILLGLIIYGGWLYTTSEGDPEKTNKAKEILKNAAIGLLIILSAFAIVNFILRALWDKDGGLGRGGGPGENWNGVVALGDGILESHYPERDQTDVPINTMIFITFKEEIQPGTICEDANSDGQCKNETLISNNIHIYPTDAAGSDAPDTNDLRRADERVLVTSNDNKTFIFRPLDFLGAQGSPAWFAVKLLGDRGGGGIKKMADGEKVEFSSFGDDYYKWKFETNGKLDLTPPRVVSIFPPADNERDIINSGVDAVAATGSITVNSRPRTYQAASRGNAVATNSERAAVFGDYTCDWAGKIEVSISNNAATVEGQVSRPDLCEFKKCKVEAANSRVDCDSNPNICYVREEKGIITGDSIDDQTATLGCGLTLQPADGSFAEGNSWTIAVTPEVQADTLTIGDRQFIFVAGTAGNGEIEKDADVNKNVKNIIFAIVLDESSPVVADGTLIFDNVVPLTAKTAGISGNNIRVESNNACVAGTETCVGTTKTFTITPMHDGAPATQRITTAGLPDQPRNAVVQINFNEAVNPIYVNGAAQQVGDYIKAQNISETGGTGGDGTTCSANADCLSYNCNIPAGAASGACVGDFIDGTFAISNIYKTVEFTTNNKCGVNACGEEVYCLPPLSDIKISGKAANLVQCKRNDECLPTAGILGDYNSCSSDGTNPGFCQKIVAAGTSGSTEINYPQADLTLPVAQLGITDAANNSFDGDKNGNAEGPEAQSGTMAFNENNLIGSCTVSAQQRVCIPYNAGIVCNAATDCTKNGSTITLSSEQSVNGDDYVWSFFTSNILDLNSPIIQSVQSKKRTNGSALDLVKVTGSTGEQILGTDSEEPISILFNKLMMSSSLKPGRNYPDDFYADTDPPVQKEYLIMMNYSGRPLGYWCAKEDVEDPARRDGYADWTNVIISHTQFRGDSSYGSLAGSGVKDIYQNCYNPAADIGGDWKDRTNSKCDSTTSGQSCCKGIIQSDPEKVCREFE